MKNVKELIPFLFKTRDLHRTYRATPELDGRFESDAEHSWSVAITAVLVLPYLEKEFPHVLNREKVITMCLIHDLAEIKTGDTKTWDTLARKDKEEREKEAVFELCKLLPEKSAKEVKQLWEECEKQETLEAKIVKSIDRMDPMIHRTATGVGWNDVERGQETVEALDQRQLPRHNFSKILVELFREIRRIAEINKLFPDHHDSSR